MLPGDGMNLTLNGVIEMKRQKLIFLLGLMVVMSLMMSACIQSVSTGEVTPQDSSELQDILDAVANQTPVAPADGTGGNPSAEDSLSQTQTAIAPGLDVPTPEPPVIETPTPSPTPTVVVVMPDLVVPTEYTLRKGEFPWCLARRFNIDPIALLNANGLGQNQILDPGTKLTIPQNAGEYEGDRSRSAHPTTYTVKAGDTFFSIACLYGDVWPEEIAAQNGMEMTDKLTAGSTIDIP
jgi:LysM repeat protein